MFKAAKNKVVTIAWAKQLIKEGATLWKVQNGMIIPLSNKDFRGKKAWDLIPILD